MTLLPTWTLGELALTSYPFAVEFGGDHGAPETISELVTSMLGDGDLVRQTRHGNREVSIVVQVEGPTLGVLAENEATLRAECLKSRNLLTFQPGDIDSPASVFEVLVVAMRQPRNDDHEQQMMRRWEITLTCAPFARSEELTTVPALSNRPVEAETLLVDACNSTTGWAAQVGDILALDVPNDAVRTSIPSVGDGSANQSMSLTRSAAVDMSAHDYLTVVWQVTLSPAAAASGHGAPAAQLWAGGAVVPEVARLYFSHTSGYFWYKSWYAVTSAQLAGGFMMYTADLGRDPGSGASLAVSDVRKTNQWPGVSSKQLTRIIDVGGTERTPASLHAYTEAGYLGHTIVHTTTADDSGYTPDLRRWGVSGNSTTANLDSRVITGTWEALQPNPLISRMPARALPRSDYILMAAMKSDTIGEQLVTWALKSTLAGAVIGDHADRAYHNFAVAGAMNIVPLGVLSGPIVRSMGAALEVEIHLHNPTPGVQMHVEEWWLFADGPDSALTIVNTDEASLWLDSPDVSSPVPRVWVGSGDGVARWHPAGRLIAPGSHTFAPGRVQVTTISDTNDYLEVELSYHKRWHSNAAE